MRPNMMVGTICLISAAAFAACQPSQPLDADTEPSTIDAQPAAPKAMTSTGAPKKAALKAGAKTPAVSNAIASRNVAHASAPAGELRIVDAKEQEDASVATTITGCLVMRDDGMFQLKDNDGEHAPKARSWKSGFIKKGSANIDVLDAGNRLSLGSHIGYRVSVVGTLTERKMQARSVRATSEHCD
jgi:hypothetical protein